VPGTAAVEIERPRSVWELITTSFAVYARVPVLFLALAAIVVIPFELIVLLLTGAGPLALGHTGFITSNLVALADAFLVGSLISAFHAHAVREIGEGEHPRLLPTLRRSLPALPVVIVAAGVSWFGITVGLFLIVFPGLYLIARWAVVAQTAALEEGAWTAPFGRSDGLTHGYRMHALGLVLLTGAIGLVPTFAFSVAFGHDKTTVVGFIVGVALQVVVRSFTALTTALLYFDLKARPRLATVPVGMPPPTAAAAPIVPAEPTVASPRPAPDPRKVTAPPPLGSVAAASAAPASPAPELAPVDRLDPERWSDAERPSGWWIVPTDPERMRYWAGDEEGGGEWSERTTKTPRKTRREWRELKGEG
jgi:hypothetical protein